MSIVERKNDEPIHAAPSHLLNKSKEQQSLCPRANPLAWWELSKEMCDLAFSPAAIPSSDAKNANLYFLDVVQQANTIFHLFDKQFNDNLMPLIR